MAKRTIRASELGGYLYCQRAWWYQRQGKESENQEALDEGKQQHAAHGRQVFLSGALRALGWLLLLIGLFILALTLTMSLF
jgi:hypothetical protein